MKEKLMNRLIWYALLEDLLTITLLFFAFFMCVELLLPGYLSSRFPISLLFFLLLCFLALQMTIRERLHITLSPGRLPHWVHPLGLMVFFGFFVISNLGFGYAGIMFQVIFCIVLLTLLYQSLYHQK